MGWDIRKHWSPISYSNCASRATPVDHSFHYVIHQSSIIHKPASICLLIPLFDAELLGSKRNVEISIDKQKPEATDPVKITRQ